MDDGVVARVNASTGAGFVATGRAARGKLGGAIFVRRPDGRDRVITRFHGSYEEAVHVADLVNSAHSCGAPVPRHELVVDLGDLVAFVQERMPAGPPKRFSADRVDALVAANDRFAGLLTSRPSEPIAPMCTPQHPVDLIATMDGHARPILERLAEVGATAPAEMTDGTDLVHIDLSAANVLMDAHDNVTCVVDWNLGAYRGDRHFALITTRFDREWFLRAPAVDDVERASATRLDEHIANRIEPVTRRTYWAQWLLHQLRRAVQRGDTNAVRWQLEMAAARVS